ncbi:uncharacterized protein LOC142168912 [Nicotiana tabacum]|uniref:Uncharacterized protein LOC142168912 n=1 Tax=Nicotiana tabacum TaxID=4097 RepID=A0AC58SMI7_TOBAC
MAKSDDDEDNEEDEVNFLDVQRNLKNYSQEKLISLANVLIDTYHSLISEKNILTEEIGEAEVEGSSQKWYMDRGCSKHVTGRMDDFLIFKALQGGSVSFGNGKKRYILGVGKIGKTLSHSIENTTRASFSLPNKQIKKDLRRKEVHLVIVDDYSRFTWTLFLRTKDETFPVLLVFVKQIQVKMAYNVLSIRSDHGTEFDNAKFDEFCSENGISHNFSAPRTPQQNGVV